MKSIEQVVQEFASPNNQLRREA
jgi:hypothetical protein